MSEQMQKVVRPVPGVAEVPEGSVVDWETRTMIRNLTAREVRLLEQHPECLETIYDTYEGPKLVS